MYRIMKKILIIFYTFLIPLPIITIIMISIIYDLQYNNSNIAETVFMGIFVYIAFLLNIVVFIVHVVQDVVLLIILSYCSIPIYYPTPIKLYIFIAFLNK